MTRTRRTVLAALVAVGTAGAFSSLGAWQLRRLHERRAYNASHVTERVTLTGVYDFEHQLVLSRRSHDGSPGVEVLTPLRPTNGRAAVLVDRGWVYSPDAASVDLSQWDEPPHATVVGYRTPYAHGGRGEARLPSHPNAYTRLDSAALARAIPYPLAASVVVQLSGGTAATPVRLALPARDDGPHLGYAIQWFTFATIALVGVGTLIAQDKA